MLVIHHVIRYYLPVSYSSSIIEVATKNNKYICQSNCIQLESSDQFNDLAFDWDVSLRQLQKGNFKGDFFSVGDKEAQVYQFSMNRSVEMRGCAPAGNNFRSFGFMRGGDYSGTWCNSDIYNDNLLVWGKNGEYEAITSSEFNVNVFALSDALLNEAAIATDSQDALERLSEDHLIYTSQAWRIKQSRIMLELLRHTITAQPTGYEASVCWQDMIFTIVCNITSILSKNASVDKRPAPDSRKKLSALKLAIDFIEANEDEPLTVRDLCKITRVSERTLQYGFLEHYHVSPKTYLKAVRLNGVHRQLRQVDPKTGKVADIANAWGFWHMGQFAADYYALFSEKPLTTLRRPS